MSIAVCLGDYLHFYRSELSAVSGDHWINDNTSKEYMTIYTVQCLSCHNRKRMDEVKRFCKKNNLAYEERRISYNKFWQDQARVYTQKFGVETPFILHKNKAINLYDELEKLL